MRMSWARSAVGDPRSDSAVPRSDVGVLQDVECLLHSPRAEVDGVHELAADLLQPARELVEADLVGLGGVPGEVEAAGSLLAAGRRRPPSGSPRRSCRRGSGWGDAELLDELDDVLAVAILVRASGWPGS